MSVLINEKIDNLLKTTSRSFYPTLKYLPKKVRGQIGLLYLLARVADTIADSKSGETDELLMLLRDYNDVAQGKAIDLPDFSRLAEIQENQYEAELLLNVQDVVDGLMVYSEEDRGRMLECLDIIVGGQILDLERFGPAKEGGVLSALSNNSELDDLILFLETLNNNGINQNHVLGAVNIMRQKMISVDIPLESIDTCGTGGDGKFSLNISTAVAFVLSALGIPVAKHGNRSITSNCGSADVLRALGINIDMHTDKISECIEKTGICFMFAPNHHPAMKHVAEARQILEFV